MPAEIQGQMISGSELTERECFLGLIDSLGNARTFANGLAQSRKDMRWYVAVKLLDQMTENAKRLMTKPKGIIIPGSMG